MKKYNLVLFDFDGTLFNTFLGIARSYQHALKERYHMDYPDLHEFEKCIGPPLSKSLVEFYHIPGNEVLDTVEVFRSRYATIGVFESEPYKGVKEMLLKIKDAGIQIGIASSKPVIMINKILEKNHLDGIMDFIAGLKSEEDHATKTDVIKEALDHFNADISKTVMVGDRFYDAEGADNLKLDFIAAMYGFGNDEEFAPYPCVYKANSTADVANFILGE